MHTRHNLVLATFALAALAAACPPVYQVGARQYLAVPSSVAEPPKQPAGNRAPAIDVPRTADCIQAMLKATPGVRDVQRHNDLSHTEAFLANIAFTIADSALESRVRGAGLQVSA